MKLHLASANPSIGQPTSARLAHDMRNTLATIALHLETLDRLAGPHGAKAASAAHALVAKGADICNEVIRHDADPNSPVRRSGFDVVATVRQVSDVLHPLLPEAFEIRTTTSGTVTALANAQDVFRILFNLAHNAVMVARRTRRLSEVEFAAETTAATVTVRISDNGPGLPRDVRAALFRWPAARFVTAVNGYGLAIARELAERNGGTLEYVPTTSGTTFVLTLQRLATATQTQSPVTRLMGRAAMRT